jgi:Zn-dependent protease with chaperone function
VTQTAPAELCPKCQVSLVSYDHQDPWCERCEWKLDTFDNEPLPWPWGFVVRWDRRLGFDSDRRLVDASTESGAGEWFLRGLSALLMLIVLGIAGFGVWLVVRSHFFGLAVMAALILFGIAYWLRPRLGRVKPLMRDTFTITEEKRPALFALMRRVAEAAGTKMPHVVGLSSEWDARAAVVGLRRRRVVVLGVPLLAALRPQERVALLAHEFGHLAQDDSLRQLMRQPALTHFGMLARAVRAPKARLQSIFLVVWRLVGGTLSALLWLVHYGLNVLGAKENRRTELRADLLAARLAGTTAALGTTDVLACVRELGPYVGPSGEKGRVMQSWHEKVEFAREQLTGRLPRLRQLTMRTDAGLFASHPAPGRRYQVLARQAYQHPAIVLTDAESARIDAELQPYAEAVRKELEEERYGL